MSRDSGRVSLRGAWWRVVAAELDPLELRDPPGDGRWQRGEVVGATYLADSEATVWAEWYRMLAEAALPPRVALPVDLWRIDVDLSEVADLSAPAAMAAVGLAPPSPGRSGWPPYQAIGERLHCDGHAGVLAPSAARPGGLVLCIFRGQRPPGGVRRVGEARRIAQAPAPPRGLRT